MHVFPRHRLPILYFPRRDRNRWSNDQRGMFLDRSEQRGLGHHLLEQRRLGNRDGRLFSHLQPHLLFPQHDLDDRRKAFYGESSGLGLHLFPLPFQPILHPRGWERDPCRLGCQRMFLERLQPNQLGHHPNREFGDGEWEHDLHGGGKLGEFVPNGYP